MGEMDTEKKIPSVSASIPPEGMLPVYKEAGWTSFDVAAKLRGILHTRKVGHTGTLDPEAEGVLPVLYGRATRLAELLSDSGKAYRAVLRLGVETDTQDMTGQVLRTWPLLEEELSRERICRTAESFLGDQMQIPPMYSALKVQGKKLVDLARSGVTVERQARPVHFDEIRVTEISLPLVTLEVSCSKGTYIRTLCHDIGQQLGCGGAMESLVRTRAGDVREEECLRIAQIQRLADEGGLFRVIRTSEQLFIGLPELTIPKDLDRLALNGNSIDLSALSARRVRLPETADAQNRLRLYTSEGRFVGLFEVERERERLHALKMLI